MKVLKNFLIITVLCSIPMVCLYLPSKAQITNPPQGGGSGTVSANNGVAGAIANYAAAAGSTTVGPDAALTDASNTLTYTGSSGLLASAGPLASGANGGAAGVIKWFGSTSGSATCTAPAVAGTITNGVVCTNTFSGPGLTNPSGAGGLTFSGSTLLLRSANTAAQVAIQDNAGNNYFNCTSTSCTTASTLTMGFSGGKGQHFVTQAANNDVTGTCTAAAATTCTVTFTTAYTSAPACIAVDATNITTLKVTPSTTNLVITTSAASSDVFDYACYGNPN